jgi:cardiolipin synthase
MMHAKTAVFDESVAIIGTSNLDRQSFERSYEVNLVIAGGEVPRSLRRNFERDCAGATSLDEASLAARGPLESSLDALAALLLRFV